MAMNWLHRKLCGSERWAERVEREILPWALEGVDLGAATLEIGPGYGANLRVLRTRAARLTALEIDEELASRLDRRFGTDATVIHGDGTAMPLPDGEFTSVVCFTMLHHVPTAPDQDRLFAEAFRVLAPGGVFAGSDGVHSFGFRLIHLGDTYNPIPPDTLPARLSAAGFADIRVDTAGRSQRFRAVRR
jgi:SAM-dependent methyltransferase